MRTYRIYKCDISAQGGRGGFEDNEVLTGSEQIKAPPGFRRQRVTL